MPHPEASGTIAEDVRDHLADLVRCASDLDVSSVARATESLLDAHRRGSTVFVLGNGGSAAAAEHFASDLGKYATGSAPGFRSMYVGGNVPSLTAWINDDGWEGSIANMLRPWLRTQDVVVAFSVHGSAGWSGNLARALTEARSAGATSIGIASNGGGQFLDLCDITIVIPSAPGSRLTPVAETLHTGVAHLIASALRSRLNGEEP